MSNRVNTSAIPKPNLTGAAVSNIQAINGSLSSVVVAKPPAYPVVMTLHGRTPPIGDHFRLDQPLYPAKVIIGDNKFVHYHVIVWTQLFGQDVSDYGCVYTNGDGLRLCFNSRSSLQKFENWWKRYERIFFSDGSLRKNYAPVPVEGKLSGYYVEDVPTPVYGNIGGGNFQLHGVQGVAGAAGGYGQGGAGPTYMHAASHDTISTVFLSDWVMILRHATKRVVRMAGGWLFASPKDGIMFKMQRS